MCTAIRYQQTFAFFAGLLTAIAAHPSFAAQPSAGAVAKRVDQALTKEVFQDPIKLAPISSDAIFLRRVWLDLVGDIPAPEDLTAFVRDSSPNKRQRVVQTLLKKPQYGQNWARYWRDVVFSRRSEDRALLATSAMEADLTKQLNEGVGWDEIAAQFITATGDVRKNGSAALLMAQGGQTEEITAEVSRIFLGIQIQCAQCHDHPYDRWKREQFHELAAFFPRTGIRRIQGLTPRSFEVYGNDRHKRRKKQRANQPTPEHFMPDLEDPSAPGKQMQPKFFLTRSSVPLGTRDAARREQLAEWLTDNRWFGIALVNRLWSELVGEGFYEPVDDIGPDRKALSPTAVNLLAHKFRESGYDLRWLLQTICLTEAYQRDSAPRRGPEDTPFTANVPQRLRGDQLFNAVLSALDVDESDEPQNSVSGRRPMNTRTRNRFIAVFNYDPSISREEVTHSIPQMLALMNAPIVNRAMLARKGSLLAELLHTIEKDEDLVTELFLRCLSRKPTSGELAEALAYGEQIHRRREVFEDLLWALLNSAEFQHRR